MHKSISGYLAVIVLCTILHPSKGDFVERKEDGDNFQGAGCPSGCSCQQATHVFGEIFADSKCVTDYRTEFGTIILVFMRFSLRASYPSLSSITHYSQSTKT